MTPVKQLQAIKWVAATFGTSIVGLVIWGATITSEVGQMRSELDDIWEKYNLVEKEKTEALAEFAAFKQEVKDMKAAVENEKQNELFKLFFKHQNQGNEKPKRN